MTDANQDAQDQRAYDDIREVAAHQLKMWWAGIAFEPLFGQHLDVVSVTVAPWLRRVNGREPLWLTVWQGYRDGLGNDGSEEGLWLLLEEVSKFKFDNPTWRRNAVPTFLPIDPDASGLGLTLPDLGLNKESLLELIRDMLKLLAAAVPVHARRADRNAVFAALNAALEGEVVEASDGDSGLVADLEQLCADSDLEAVDFGPFGASGPGLFATRTILDVGEQIPMTVWSEADTINLINVAGHVQRMDVPDLIFPGEDKEEADMIADLAEQLAEIHDVASTIFEQLEPADPETAFDLLNAVAYAAMNGDAETGGPAVRPWHRLADRFAEHCRLGFLAGVMLEESPFGNLNIRASTVDPVTRTTTYLQVYWQQDDEADDAEHWLSVGTATGPAHDVDLDYPDLLTGIPADSREFILHAISHLHEMVHLAGSLLEARAAETLSFLEARQSGEEIPEDIRHEMIRTAIEDSIAGLNGVARLYTGEMPG